MKNEFHIILINGGSFLTQRYSDPAFHVTFCIFAKIPCIMTVPLENNDGDFELPTKSSFVLDSAEVNFKKKKMIT